MTSAHTTGATSARPAWTTWTLHAATVVVGATLLGAVGGFLWLQAWEPPVGIVVEGQWVVPGEAGLRASFSATGWFIVIGALGGLVLGLAAGFSARSRELVALAAVILGSVVAVVVMCTVGMALDPPDPNVLAGEAEDQTRLDGEIGVGGWSPYLVLPAGALLGVVVPLMLLPGRADDSTSRESSTALDDA